MTAFIVLSSWLSCCRSSSSSFDECRTAQVAADLWTKQMGFRLQTATVFTSTVAIYYYQLQR